ncbi:MAG: phosphoribosyltransferase [Alcaligenaceae bacterium]|nr:phosphoribosyltransferase [Alcaligenaceae bacterium]
MPRRVPWNDFPDVIIHASESSVKKHPAYPAAKAGDADSAQRLVDETVSLEAVESIKKLLGERRPYLASAHAFERDGVNSIPQAIADKLASLLGLEVERSIVQVNVVRHTGASGYGRLARQALFQGNITPGTMYFLVDDFIGQGGTLANLRGFIETEGGTVLGATVLTGKPFSAQISLGSEQLLSLRKKHGQKLESWWHERFGHAFDCLTQSEARYLERSEDVDAIRDRIAAQE